ncbi:excalibur calcium-binding domain-containing protein [Mycobacterium asiaticum]
MYKLDRNGDGIGCE